MRSFLVVAGTRCRYRGPDRNCRTWRVCSAGLIDELVHAWAVPYAPISLLCEIDSGLAQAAVDKVAARPRLGTEL